MKNLIFILAFCLSARADLSLLTNSSHVIFVGDSITDEQAGSYSVPWPYLVEGFYTLRNPHLQLHFRTEGRGGDAIGPLPSLGMVYTDSNRTNNSRYDRRVIGYNFSGPSNYVVCMWGRNNSGDSNTFAGNLSNLCVNYIIASNNATPVLVGEHPENQSGGDTALRDKSLACVTLGTLSNWPYSDTWGYLTNRFGTNLAAGEPVSLRWQDQTHPSNRWPIAWAVLTGLIGTDTNVSLATIDYGGASVTSTTRCAVASIVRNESGISFTRYDLRLPMPRDVRLLEALPLIPEIEGMNWMPITVTNLPQDNYRLWIDGQLVANVTSLQLSNGFNLFTLTNGAYYTQGQTVYSNICFKHGLSNATLAAWSPSTNVAKYKSNADSFYSYDVPVDPDGRHEGATLIADLASVVTAIKMADTNIHNAAQPVARRFVIQPSKAPAHALKGFASIRGKIQ